MALDMSKLLKAKAAIEEKNNRGGGSFAKFWRPTKASSTIRIMPDWSKEEPFAGQFWRVIVQHWIPNPENPDKNIVITCEEETPHMSGAPCDVCAYVSELRENKTSVEDQELAKQLRGKTAYLMNIIDMADPEYNAADLAEYVKANPDKEAPFKVGDAKIQVYAAPMSVFNSILGIINTNEVDITCPDRGNNITIEKSGKGLTTKYNVQVQMKSTPCKQFTADTVLPALDKIGQTMEREKLLKLLPLADRAPALTSGNVKTTAGSANVGNGDSVDALSASLRAALQG